MSVQEAFTKELKKKIEAATLSVQKSTENKNKEKTFTLIVGHTGSGKTTLLHMMAGKPLVSVEDKSGLLYLEAKEPWDNENGRVAIGHTVMSETSTPNVWGDDANGIVFFDCPGSFDTEVERRVINAFSIDQILAQAKKVKIVLVVSQSELDSRATNAMESLTMLSKMIPNEADLKKAVAVVVTKVKPRMKPLELMRRLASANGECSSLINNIVDEGRVFSFPEPTEVGIEYKAFEDKERLLTFLKQNPAINPSHQPVIDSAAQMMLVQLGQSYNSDIFQSVNSLIAEIEKATKSVKDEKKLQEWVTVIGQLDSASKKSWKEFSDCCQNVSLKNGSLKGPTQKITGFVPWVEFLTRIMSISEETKKIMATDNSPNSSLQLASREFHHLSENIKAEINRIQNEKREAELKKKVEQAKAAPPRVVYVHTGGDDDDICCIQ